MDGNNLNWFLEHYENTNKGNSVLSSLDDYEKIPQVDSTSFKNFSEGALVRYRGMVQDMLDPEYYSSTVNKDNNVKPRKIGDVPCELDEDLILEAHSALSERWVFFCVPLPGTNNWVQEHQQKQNTPDQHEKTSTGVKREANSDEEMEIDEADPTSHSSTKKNKTTHDENKVGSQSYSYSNSKYFPFPGESGLSCIVKVYKEEESSKILLNDRIEVVGFLSLNPGLEANWEDADVEDKARHPPPSLVPRIHAVMVKKLRHCNPLLKQIIPYGDLAQLVESARSELHLILTQMLFEDTTAAEYLLCHLLSRIYIRNETNTIGKLSLNLFNINSKNFCSGLYEVIKTLVTNSHFVPLSTHLLNEASFIPKKDYESNRLWSGMLQLCDDIHLVVDETKMNEGQLNNTGYLNVVALQKLFRDQEVHYDFGYYPLTYNSNVPLLVLSEGKSMFEADVRLRVKPNLCTESQLKESFEAVRLYLNKDVSNKIRTYLTAMRLKDFELTEEMGRKIEEDYVSMAQQDRQVNSSDLHTLLILSRLLALSHGRSALSPEDWNRAREMETERKLRLKQ